VDGSSLRHRSFQAGGGGGFGRGISTSHYRAALGEFPAAIAPDRGALCRRRGAIQGHLSLFLIPLFSFLFFFPFGVYLYCVWGRDGLDGPSRGHRAPRSEHRGRKSPGLPGSRGEIRQPGLKLRRKRSATPHRRLRRVDFERDSGGGGRRIRTTERKTSAGGAAAAIPYKTRSRRLGGKYSRPSH